MRDVLTFKVQIARNILGILFFFSSETSEVPSRLRGQHFASKINFKIIIYSGLLPFP
jgi:hypothetical protein